MKKYLFLAVLLALLLCSCQRHYLKLNGNQKLCTVQSVLQTSEGYVVCLEKDTFFYRENPKIEPNSIVVIDYDSMRLAKLYYSVADSLLILKNNQNVCHIRAITKCGDEYIVCTDKDHYVFNKKPDFTEGDIVIIKPDMTVLAPFSEPTYIQYSYLKSAYESISTY